MTVSESGRLLAEAAREYGLTQKQLGNVLGVSDRMVRSVLSGAKPGANLLGAARQLAESGRVTVTPIRREQRVRTGRASVSERPVAASKSGEETAYTFEGGGRSQTAVRAPSRGLGRERARKAILSDLEARKGGKRARGAQRVAFRLVLKDGTEINLGSKGGYDPRMVARRMHDDADDPFRWLFTEADSIPGYDDKIGGASEIREVVLTYF